VPISVGVGLEEDGAGRELGGVGSDGEGGREIREVEDGFRQEKGFEGVEGFLAGGGPVPLEIFLGEVDERTSDVGVVGDESSIEIGEAKEGAYVLDFSGGRPFGNSVELDGIHG